MMRWVGVALMAFVMPAQADTWTCAFTELRGTGYIATDIRFQIQGVYKDVRVSDAIIAQKFGEWTQGKLQTSNDTRVTVMWQVPHMQTPKSETQFRNQFTGSFSLTVIKADGRAKVFMGGPWDRTAHAVGQCALVGS